MKFDQLSPPVRCLMAHMEQRLAVARALACQTIEKRGEHITDDEMEPEAAIIAKRLSNVQKTRLRGR